MEPMVSPIQSGGGTGSAVHPGGSVAGMTVVQQPQRETFAADELAIVLSHYDLGVIDTVTEFPRGSRKAPKLLIAGERGKFLLKRRARGRDEPQKVAFTHALQLYLTSKQFPLPHLIGTRRHNNSMLQTHGGVYELFEYVVGQPCPQSVDCTRDSGRILATFHKLLADFRSEWRPGTGSYHAAPAVAQAVKVIQSRPETAPDVRDVVTFLSDSYQHAAEMAEQVGLSTWPKQIVHADWHPGNMLFNGDRIVAVIDYDAARFLPRVVDVANGALQFAILGGDDDTSRWPAEIDEARFAAFLRGYDGVSLLTEAEFRAMPWLMIEAMIAEAVIPIATTGHFGRLEGAPFLRMIQRKVEWVQKSVDRLIDLAEG
jgi:Ser/Thr protein kinase RdoA (MazF antagonist)